MATETGTWAPKNLGPAQRCTTPGQSIDSSRTNIPVFWRVYGWLWTGDERGLKRAIVMFWTEGSVEVDRGGDTVFRRIFPVYLL